jgi:two-component system sensor kinase FixL
VDDRAGAPPWVVDRPWATAVVFVAAYVALDRVSYLFPVEPFAITPWNPQAGLSVAFLLLLGRRLAPALFVAALLADVLVRGGGVQIGYSAASSLVIALGYAGLGAFLRSGVRVDPSLRRVRDVAWLAASAVPASLAVAIAYVGLHGAPGFIPPEGLVPSVLRLWIGDMIGIVVTTPVLLLLATARRPLALGVAGRRAEIAGQIAAIVATLVPVLVLGDAAEPRFFYLLFPPIIWIALRHGLPGASLATLLVQLVLIAVLAFRGYAAENVLEFQFRMLALALVGAFLGIAVTERTRAASALARSESELRTIWETAPDGLVTLDPSGRVVTANPAAERLLGARAAELEGRPFAEVVEGFPPLPVETTAMELPALRPGGARVPLEVSVAPAPETLRHIATLRDVSPRKAAEEKLRGKEEELAGVLRFAAAGQVASSLAHELNQPLYALSTYVQSCQLIASRPDGDRALLAELMEKAVREVARAGEVVRRLREFFQTGATRLEAVALRRLLEDAAEASRRRTERHHITVSVECAPDGGELRVDRLQLEIVLHNLVSNAVDAIVAGRGERREIRLAGSTAEGRGEIRVEDTGPGVAPEVAARLFEPFTTTKPEGMGLGLAIARYIVEAHGGRLWVEPLPTGSAFRISLPLEASGAD